MASNLFEKNKTKSQSSKCSEMVSKGPCFLAKTTTWARWAILNYSLGTFFISSILSLWLAPVSTKISCMSGWNWNKRSHKKLNFFLSRKLFNLVFNLDCLTRKVISSLNFRRRLSDGTTDCDRKHLWKVRSLHFYSFKLRLVTWVVIAFLNWTLSCSL